MALVGQYEGSPCEAIVNAMKMTVNREINKVGMTGLMGEIPLPCRVPAIPTLPDAIAHLYDVIIPNCIEEFIDDCKDLAKAFNIENIYIIRYAMKGHASPEDAEKYWMKIDVIPMVILEGDYEGERLLVALIAPVLAPGHPVLVNAAIVHTSETFNLRYGPQGLIAPNLLDHYKKYKVMRVGDRLAVEEA